MQCMDQTGDTYIVVLLYVCKSVYGIWSMGYMRNIRTHKYEAKFGIHLSVLNITVSLNTEIICCAKVSSRVHSIKVTL